MLKSISESDWAEAEKPPFYLSTKKSNFQKRNKNVE
jgi:hypothetical protein